MTWKRLIALLSNFPHVKIVRLANTRIHGINNAKVDDFFKRLLARESVEFVDVSGTGFASVDRTDFFQSLIGAAFKKLIWIPEAYLVRRTWERLVPPEVVDMVMETHMQFYRET